MAATTASTAKLGASEDILGHKASSFSTFERPYGDRGRHAHRHHRLRKQTDLALSNGLVKTGTGLAAGVVLSALLFRRRAFPVWLCTGIGMGESYAW